MPATPGQQIPDWHPGPSLERDMAIPPEHVAHAPAITRERLIGKFLTSSQATDYTGYPKLQRAIAEGMADEELARQALLKEAAISPPSAETTTITLITDKISGFVGPVVIKQSRVNC